MQSIDENALKAKNDKAYAETFFKENESFILQAAYKATGHYITKSDDQWSISLYAFYEAIRSYSREKGTFLSFAQLVIRRRLNDEYKKQSKHLCEISINPCSIENDPDEEDEDVPLKREVIASVISRQENSAKLEIEALSQEMCKYSISFTDLISASPKSKKTKKICAKAIAYIVQRKPLYAEMTKVKELPLKILDNDGGLPRKTLERHRKYIIAGIEILCGDYPMLSEYFKFVKEEHSL